MMVKIGKKHTRYVLAVVPGNARVDLSAVTALLGGTYVTVAGKDKAEMLAGSVSGTVLPISYSPQLELIADPSLLAFPELFFNAARARPLGRRGDRGLPTSGRTPDRDHHRGVVTRTRRPTDPEVSADQRGIQL